MGKRRRAETEEPDEDVSESNTSKVMDQTASFNEEAEEDGNAHHGVDPVLMLKLVKEFHDYVEKENKTTTSIKGIKPLAEKFIAATTVEIGAELFLSSFRKYLQSAVKLSNLSVYNGMSFLTDYLNSPDVIMSYPDFPKRVPSLNQYYAKKFNYALFHKGLSGIISKDDEGRKICEAELVELDKKFLDDLMAFGRNHPELVEGQKSFLESKIKNVAKKVNGPQPSPTPRKLIQKKTAFDYFVFTVKDKYTDLDPEQREQKLRKKFDKLPDETKGTFEKIAMAM